ncbi:glycosyltransferase involved in cell wall biosynthesis [Gillisia sp. Hel_I_86]|uniref:glycosyltransferase n=1 Tax=Gillisia sp. Hel_I_86 TaxID=1249981 RepID=UPI001199FF50|nr:glycosyltransferase [Gillisia sp. Hel_I_86]TVZ25581.1 glycosyltransferase involved in cell wall biosynthesis [Gillisia sp. Hel_I_86]
MKILIVNTYDKGGAANSCIRLYKGLIKNGVKTSLLLQKKTKNLPSAEIAKPLQLKITKLQKAKKGLKKVLKELNLYSNPPLKETPFVWKRASKLEMFSYPASNFDIMQTSAYKEADIVNLHWVANFLDYKSFFKNNKKPVVWTLHDMNPFSGGEHYTELFSGLDEEGYPIKRLITGFEKQEFEKVVQIKKNALEYFKNLTIVAPSHWLANEARNSEVFKGMDVQCIPYGLDPQIFAPRDKAFSRKLLNIPQDKVMILFVADSTSIPRKGFEFLKRAIKQIKMENLILCAIGSKNAELESDNDIIELGSIKDERLMSVAYSAADIFVIPSIMDNLPNTVLESLMCGTPVIGFPVGGIPDMIEPGKNGLLTKEISANALVETLTEFLNDPEKFDSKKIRKEALAKYDHKIQAERYHKLFKNILENNDKI